MTYRIERLRKFFKECQVDAVLVTDDVSISYLTRTPSHESWLLITPTKAYYITDARYSLEVSERLADTGIQVVLFKGSIAKEVLRLARSRKVKVLGLDERCLSVAHFRKLTSLFPKGMRPAAVDGLVDVLRMVKDEEEVDLIRKALKVNNEAFRYLEGRIKPGVREADLLGDLEGFIRRKKVAFAFPPIIASGPRSAMPHATVSERKLLLQESLLVDMGILKDGYRSDLTRMFFLGRMTRSFKGVLSRVKEAQEAAIKVIRPGVLAKTVDAAARKCLKKHDLDSYFTHSLGHGVGLDIHESPRISQKSGVVIAENMVFTIEPGVYLPGRFGVRLEEMVLVTKSGCEVL